MKKRIANILLRLLMHADASSKSRLYEHLKEQNSATRYAGYRKKYQIAESFRFNGLNILFYGEGTIICGQNSYIGDYSTVQVAKNQKVSIGNNCSISHNVRIYTTSNTTDQDLNTTELKEKVLGNVSIGNGVWIGANVFIKEGITIGDNVIVGANAVITKDMEANGVYGGVPARLIRMKSYHK